VPTLLARNARVLVTMGCERRELEDAGLYAGDGIIRPVGAQTAKHTVVDGKREPRVIHRGNAILGVEPVAHRATPRRSPGGGR
jgi:hypothetical protein